MKDLCEMCLFNFINNNKNYFIVFNCILYLIEENIIPGRIEISLETNSPCSSSAIRLWIIQFETQAARSRNFFLTNNATMQKWGHSPCCVGMMANKISEVNQIGKKTIRSSIPPLTHDILTNARHDWSQLIDDISLSYIHIVSFFYSDK